MWKGPPKSPSKRGKKYKSRLEAVIAKRLGKKALYETEVIHYLIPKRYIPDFVVSVPGRSSFYIEVKGYFRYEDQQKLKAVKQCNPGIDLRLYFPSDGRVQGSKLRCSEWAKKYNFPYAVGRIPREWLA